MNLKYRILWIENEKDWVESIEDQIQEYLENLGFICEKKLIAKEEQDISYNDYDLILMDLNLAEQPNGADLISKIRDLGVYTDVVFYSASGIDELRAKGREKELEGVFYSSRTPDTIFVNRVKAVINATLKKVQDLNNLRGLVMAEVSELDGMMVDLIYKYYVQNETSSLKTTFHDHITKRHDKKIKKELVGCRKKEMVCFHKWENMPISYIVTQLEASQLAKAVNYIVPKELYIPSRANFFEDYKAEILEIRNELAHCKSEVRDGKEVLLTRSGDKCFDATFFKEIRKNILKYSNIFNALL